MPFIIRGQPAAPLLERAIKLEMRRRYARGHVFVKGKWERMQIRHGEHKTMSLRRLQEDMKFEFGLDISISTLARIINARRKSSPVLGDPERQTTAIPALGIYEMTGVEVKMDDDITYLFKKKQQAHEARKEALKEKRRLYPSAYQRKPPKPPHVNTPDEFWAKVDQSAGMDSCWPWLPAGKYPRMRWQGKETPAQWIAAKLSNPDLDLTPLNTRMVASCQNNRCCNPKHLQAIKQRYLRKIK